MAQKKKYEREKKQCPKCKKWLFKLPRHLKNVHKWGEEAARKAVNRCGLRKPYSYKGERSVPPKWKDYHHYKSCPIDDCKGVVKRMSQHLVNKHKLKVTSWAYRDALKKAQPFKPSLSEQETEVGDNSKSVKVAELPGSATVQESETTVDQFSDTSSIDLFDSMEEGETRNTESENGEILDSFRMWMESADGGKKEATTAAQHKSQLEKV